MRHLILSLLLAAASVGTAQVPDSTRGRLKTPQQYGTDSVKHGHEVYNGQTPRKSKSNGDTLSNPKNNSKSGSMNSKTPQKGNK